jgi:hypothetical protein
MVIVYKSDDEIVYMENNLYHHIKTLTPLNINKFDELIHHYLYTSILLKGWLETPTEYHYITKGCLHLPKI